MRVTQTGIPDVLMIEPDIYTDARGFFMETWNHEKYMREGIPAKFVQDNLSFSRKNVLRGLHYQFPKGQDKLVWVLEGEVLDVAVDIRKDSETFGGWVSVKLSSESRNQFFIPKGFAHGFYVLSETALLCYKCSDFYVPSSDRGIAWDDPDIGIVWPSGISLLSQKDKNLPKLKEISPEFLPWSTQ